MIFIKAKIDFIAENYELEPDLKPASSFNEWLIKEKVAENWRPRKMWRDS